MKKLIQTPAIGLSAGLMLVAAPAHAYLDPGTGSLILQGIIGTCAAGAAFIGIYWSKFKALLNRGNAAEKNDRPKTD